MPASPPRFSGRPVAARIFGAVDIGASSGRVIAGVIDAGTTTLHVIHRFANGTSTVDGHLRWNLTNLYGEVLVGLRALATAFPDVESIGIDTWAVDYGLLDADGKLLSEPISYRDNRTDGVIGDVHARVDPQEMYTVNGLQFLPFNTVYQLAAEQQSPNWDQVVHVVLLPDLLAYWLTGELRTEVTNASTTGLLDVHTGQWATELFTNFGMAESLFPALEQPGTQRGHIRPEVVRSTGLSSSTVVTTVGSHDTASAVVAVPSTDTHFAYISSGTWSLAGLELAVPIVTEDARRANFTNEGGVDGRTRFLRNIGGLWLLQESLRSWAREGIQVQLHHLLDEAEALRPSATRIDVDDTKFIAPGGMPARIRDAAGLSKTAGPAEVTRCILDSLASAYRHTVHTAEELAGANVKSIAVVGGGSQNSLLCQLTANESGLPVSSGPVEATALGNILVQARSRGAAPSSLEEIRQTIAHTHQIRHYEPE